MSKNGNQKKEIPLFPFIGWRIWKRRNDLIFQNKKWAIPDVINKALVDVKTWSEAVNLANSNFNSSWDNNSQNINESNVTIKTVEEVISMSDDYCCLVDGSWISSNQYAGIGWALYNKEAKLIVMGKAAIEPMISPLEVEAEALRMAMMQVKSLGYEKVTFCGDSSDLYQPLMDSNANQLHLKWKHSALASYMEDVSNMASGNTGYRFLKIPRNVNAIADVLAKNARTNLLNYVISWNSVN